MKRKYTSPYLLFTLFSVIMTGSLFFYFIQYTEQLIAYLFAINISIFLLYGYDKFASSTSRLRVPEAILHILALLGASPAGISAQKIFNHKTVKKSFQVLYWFIVLLQCIFFVWYFKLF